MVTEKDNQNEQIFKVLHDTKEVPKHIKKVIDIVINLIKSCEFPEQWSNKQKKEEIYESLKGAGINFPDFPVGSISVQQERPMIVND